MEYSSSAGWGQAEPSYICNEKWVCIHDGICYVWQTSGCSKSCQGFTDIKAPDINRNQCSLGAELFIVMWSLDQKLVLMFLKLVVIEIIKLEVAFISKDIIVESKKEGILKDQMS